MLLCVDFCGGYCSFLVNYSVGLEKAGLRVNRVLSQAAKEKRYRVKHKSAIFEKGHRPILIKKIHFWNRHIISYRMAFVVSFEHFMTFRRTVHRQGRDFISLWECPSPPPPNDGLSLPMTVRKGMNSEETSDLIRILMVL